MTAAATTTPFAVTGRLLSGAAPFEGAVVVQGDRIVEVRHGPPPAGLPAIAAAVVAPGLVDMQVNGAFGYQVEDGEAAVRAIAERLPAVGVTSWLPTLVSLPEASYAPLLAEIAAAAGGPGAQVLGVHMEGPLVAAARRGAHDAAAVEAASPELYDRLPAPVLATVAPERPGAPDLIARLGGRGVLVSLGHTDAEHDAFVEGIDRGARMVTHLWNGMRGVHHRDPGAAGAALDDDRVACGLIVDGVHVHPAMVRLAWRCKGPDGIVLVSDSVSAAGMPAGRYRLGGRDVVSDGRAVRAPGGALAGSLLTLLEAVRNLMAMTGADLYAAVRCASETPARLLGRRDKGRIEVGRDADLLLFGPELELQGAIVGGRVAFGSGAA